MLASSSSPSRRPSESFEPCALPSKDAETTELIRALQTRHFFFFGHFARRIRGNDTLVVQWGVSVRMQRLKHKVTGHAVDLDSLLHEGVLSIDRHAVRQKTHLRQYHRIAHVHKLVW